MFLKKDLKPGMLVYLKNGREYIYVGDNLLYNYETGGKMYLDQYDELLQKENDSWSVDYVLLIEEGRFSHTKAKPAGKEVENKFMIMEADCTVVYEGLKTTVTLNSDTDIVGSSRCLPGDEYSKEKGFKIAFHKMMIEYCKKKIAEEGH